MLQNIVFDMGNVLILYDAQRYVNAHIENEEDRKIVLEELFGSVEWIRMDRGNISQEEVERAVCARIPAHLHKTIAFLLDNWHEDIPPFPEMEELVRELHSKQYGIYLLSNTCQKYHHFRKYLPAIELFNGEFISSDYGLLKPSAAMFEVFCTRFGLRPETCLFIDDSPTNVEGAMHAGLQGFIYRRNIGALRAALAKAGVDVQQEPPV